MAVETDLTRIETGHGRPASLDRSATEQLLAHLATDLAELLPGVRRQTLVLAGALYDPAEVLRPGWPLFEALQRLERAGRAGGPDRPGLIAVGAAEGQMPLPALRPDPDSLPGILNLLCLQLTGEPGVIATLAEEAEHRCMEQGQLSPESARALEAAFEQPVAHARFMTLTDLEAMLRLQLEHFGFLPLWELLDAALHGREPFEIRASTESASAPPGARPPAPHGPRFNWDGERVGAEFETFDHWAGTGAGRDLPAEGLEAAYGDWVRTYRQYLVTLAAHEVPLEQHLPGVDQPLKGGFLVESSALQPGPRSAAITEHQSSDLGTLAVSVVQGARLLNYYPLSGAGLNELHEAIAEAGLGGIAFPGRLLFDPEHRQLRPGSL